MDPLDLDRLARVRRAVAVPMRERDAAWIPLFEDAFWPAPLVAFETMEFDAPDGHGFLRLSTRDGQEGWSVVRPASLVDRAVEAGRGIVLTDEGDITQVWLGLGEVLAYRLYGRAFAILPEGEREFTLRKGETLRLAPPDDFNFPHAARLNVRRHLQRVFGIATPRACWIGFPDGKSGLAFDLSDARLADEAEGRRAFDAIRWLLPARIAYYRVDALRHEDAMRPF